MRTTTFMAALFLASTAGTANAQSFMGLGDPNSGDGFSFANNVSADGSYVTGRRGTSSGLEAFLWSTSTGMVGLGVPSGSDSSDGLAVSNDGSIVFGFHLPEFGTARALQWTSGGGASNFDPFPSGTFDRFALDASADGQKVVGWYRPGELHDPIAYRWDESTLTMLADASIARAISTDGNVAAGRRDNSPNGPTQNIEAFRWTEDDGAIGLGYLPGGSGLSDALGISAKGMVIVGVSKNASSSDEAFRWTQGDGMVGLGDLPGGDFDSRAFDASAEGDIIVGRGTTTTGLAPFIWDEIGGMRNLVDVLTMEYGLSTSLVGWELQEATAISDDGTVIIGNGINPDGNPEAWRVVLVPEPSAAFLGAVTCLGIALLRIRRRA